MAAEATVGLVRPGMLTPRVFALVLADSAALGAPARVSRLLEGQRARLLLLMLLLLWCERAAGLGLGVRRPRTLVACSAFAWLLVRL